MVSILLAAIVAAFVVAESARAGDLVDETAAGLIDNGAADAGLGAAGQPDPAAESAALVEGAAADTAAVAPGTVAVSPAPGGAQPAAPADTAAQTPTAPAPTAPAPGATEAPGAAPAAGGNPQQQAGQLAESGQVANAAANVVQTQPTNIAVPTVVSSADSNIVIIQTNAASAGAAAVNATSIDQTLGQAQGGGTAIQSAAIPAGEDAVADAGTDSGGGTVVWIWDWDWTWTGPGPTIELPTIDWPSVADWPFFGLTMQANGHQSTRSTPANSTSPRNDEVQGAANAAAGPPTALLGSSGRAASQSLSSNVQRSAASAPLDEDSPVRPAPAAPGGSGGGGGISPLTIVFGALLALAIQLASAASLLGRRFSLARVAWRRQAYATPLERPG